MGNIVVGLPVSHIPVEKTANSWWLTAIARCMFQNVRAGGGAAGAVEVFEWKCS
jgi:hypothetical protein